jgi:hypothetical protein
VLNDLSSAWAAHEGLDWRSGRGSSPQQVAASLGIEPHDYLESLDRFRRHEYCRLDPNPLILDWLTNEGRMVRSIAITRTPLRAAATVSSWVLKNFGQWVGAFFVVPSPRPDDPIGSRYASKADVIDGLVGVVALVDDTPDNFAGLPEYCAALEYPRPWNAGGAEDHTLERLSSIVTGFAS